MLQTRTIFPFRGQKARAPNYVFQLGISVSSYWSAEIIIRRTDCQLVLFSVSLPDVAKRPRNYQVTNNTQEFFEKIIG
jgi:hypothetical protein